MINTYAVAAPYAAISAYTTSEPSVSMETNSPIPIPTIIPLRPISESSANVEAQLREISSGNLPSFVSGKSSVRAGYTENRVSNVSHQLPRLLPVTTNSSSRTSTLLSSSLLHNRSAIAATSSITSVNHQAIPLSPQPKVGSRGGSGFTPLPQLFNFSAPIDRSNFSLGSSIESGPHRESAIVQASFPSLPTNENALVDMGSILNRVNTSQRNAALRPLQHAGNSSHAATSRFPTYHSPFQLDERVNVEDPLIRGAGPEVHNDLQRVDQRTRPEQDIGSASVEGSQLNVIRLIKGLNREILQLFPEEFFDINRDKPEVLRSCGICKMEYLHEDKLRRLPCWHAFHSACIDKWLEEQKTCPLCRFQVDLGLLVDASEVTVYGGGEISANAMLFVQEAELNPRIRNNSSTLINPLTPGNVGHDRAGTDINSIIAELENAGIANRVFPMVSANQRAMINSRLMESTTFPENNRDRRNAHTSRISPDIDNFEQIFFPERFRVNNAGEMLAIQRNPSSVEVEQFCNTLTNEVQTHPRHHNSRNDLRQPNTLPNFSLGQRSDYVTAVNASRNRARIPSIDGIRNFPYLINLSNRGRARFILRNSTNASPPNCP